MNFSKIGNVLRDAAKVVAEISMSNAVLELKHGHDVADVGIFVEVMSQYCRECSVKTRFLVDDADDLEKWKERHQMALLQPCSVSVHNRYSTSQLENEACGIQDSTETEIVRHTQVWKIRMVLILLLNLNALGIIKNVLVIAWESEKNM